MEIGGIIIIYAVIAIIGIIIGTYYYKYRKVRGARSGELDDIGVITGLSSVFWPITIAVYPIYMIAVGIGKLLDMHIQKNLKKED